MQPSFIHCICVCLLCVFNLFSFVQNSNRHGRHLPFPVLPQPSSTHTSLPPPPLSTLTILELQQGPCQIVHGGEDQGLFQEFVAGLHHLIHIDTQRRCNVVHVQTLVALWTRLERLVDTTRRLAHIRQCPSPCCPYCGLATPISTVGVPLERLATFDCASLGELLDGAAGEVKMHVSRFKQVVCDFHLIGDGAYDVRTHVAPVVERFQLSPDASPFIFHQFWFGGHRSGGVINRRTIIGVDPLFDFNDASAIVEFVGYICSLDRHVADLADESYLFG